MMLEKKETDSTAEMDESITWAFFLATPAGILLTWLFSSFSLASILTFPFYTGGVFALYVGLVAAELATFLSPLLGLLLTFLAFAVIAPLIVGVVSGLLFEAVSWGVKKLHQMVIEAVDNFHKDSSAENALRAAGVVFLLVPAALITTAFAGSAIVGVGCFSFFGSAAILSLFGLSPFIFIGITAAIIVSFAVGVAIGIAMIPSIKAALNSTTDELETTETVSSTASSQVLKQLGPSCEKEEVVQENPQITPQLFHPLALDPEPELQQEEDHGQKAYLESSSLISSTS